LTSKDYFAPVSRPHQIQELVKRQASEERIGIDEHIYRENGAYDGNKPFSVI
jgi:hypothetical protein